MAVVISQIRLVLRFNRDFRDKDRPDIVAKVPKLKLLLIALDFSTLHYRLEILDVSLVAKLRI